MEICVARQPVFTKNLNIYGYELFSYGHRREDEIPGIDRDLIRDSHSSRTIIHSFHDLGIERVTNNKRGFVSFTEKLLLDMMATILPPQILVIELAKTIPTTPEVVAACRQLRNKGYLIALDGFRPGEDALAPLLDVADIIGIEFDRENQEKFRKFARETQKNCPQTQILAKKLESPSEFELAKKCDFTLFQGSFFCKPTIVKNKALLPAPRRYQTLQLIRLSLSPDIDFHAASDIIKQDIALSYRLLRVINSAYFGLRHTVSNIRQALSILGEREFKKWITLISMSGLSENKPSELIMMCLIRARFLELLAPNAGIADQSEDLFLMGTMSLMDAVMDMPMMAIVTQTNISTQIATPLLTREGKFGNLLNLITCYEQSDWDQAQSLAAQYAISMEHISDIYIQAIEWAQKIYAGPARA
ncbi:MAG: HDOD domain-containing protein [Acidobacteriota bacterium]|jgi:EAL and modified HD-GYP domain-containing signal transduction protein|nr:HDOD domain-containing protein [Acidobacteriota bacterium]